MQCNYALRVLRYHGLDDAALQHVYRATVVARLTYAASAWHGFAKVPERQRIDSVINRARRLGYCSPDTPTFKDLCDNADDELFNKAILWSNHVLHALLTPTSASSQRYNLRQRPHLMQLPEHTTQLSDCSFLIRMLYKDTYWLLIFCFLFLFYIVMACVMSCLIKRRLIDWGVFRIHSVYRFWYSLSLRSSVPASEWW